MRVALGLSVHTGWAAAAVAGGTWNKPLVVAREHVELLGNSDRFVFHAAAEMALGEAAARVARLRGEALERAGGVMKRLAADHAVKACAVVAKKGVLRPLQEIVSAHPRIHAAEGCFFRDVLLEAAERAGMRVRVVAPGDLDANDERLAGVGRLVGKPWSVDWRVAVLAAWTVA
jgi:hypothetical protein